MSYKVASQVDSRTILDMPGAEQLLGRGDALFLPQNGEIKRVHGSYVPDEGIAKLLEPYRCKIKPLKLEIPEETTAPAKGKEPKKKQSLWRRFWNWWSSLLVRERKLILKYLKIAFFYILAYFSAKEASQSKRKRK